MSRALLVDVTRCVGCGSCTEACQQANGHPAHEATKFDENSFTYLMDRGNDVYVRRLCMHCQEPTCVSVCPVAALRKTDEGPVTYDASACMGCRYCMMACPFGVPTYEWYSAAPKVRKCEMCAKRGSSACAESCPAEATIQGDRDELIAEARRRVAEDPSAYHQDVWGIQEAGGTSVLYIGPKPGAELGLPQPPTEGALPELTWKVLKHVPEVPLYGSVLLGGFWWLTRRKEDVAREERGDRNE